MPIQNTLGGSLAAFSMLFLAAAGQAKAAGGQWSFGPAGNTAGQHVAPSTAFDSSTGFGFESPAGIMQGTLGSGTDAVGYCTCDHPFAFSAKLPEGNYNVAVTLAGVGGSSVTIKAEDRRLMAQSITPPQGKTQTVRFTVNIRTPAIAGGGHVHLKAREVHVLDWDDKLTLQFSGTHPCVSAVKIEPAPNAVTVFLAGDSTVTDQPSEPYNSWGQMLPRFFRPGVAVANYAEAGASLKSFIGVQRLDKILSIIKPGDYLFIQFGHNDQKDKSSDAGAFKSYTALLEKLVADARAHSAQPVLITPVSRRFFKGDKIINTLGDFPAAVRQLASSENVPLIDLNAETAAMYDALGPAASERAFPFPAKERTHSNDYGSYEIAKCVVDGIAADHLGLTKFIVSDWAGFDPAHPDPVGAFNLPPDPAAAHVARPEGS